MPMLKLNKEYTILILIITIFLFNLNNSVCLCSEIDIVSTLDNIDNIDKENNTSSLWNYKKIFIYTVISIGILSTLYFLYYNKSSDDPTFDSIVDIVPKDIPIQKEIIYGVKGETAKMVYFDNAADVGSVNEHLSHVSDELFPKINVFNLDLPIVSLSNTIKNKIDVINTSDHLTLNEILALPPDSLVAFSHYTTYLNNTYYQIMPISKLIEIIGEFNITL